jgi:hypothetical protein
MVSGDEVKDRRGGAISGTIRLIARDFGNRLVRQQRPRPGLLAPSRTDQQ